MGIGRVARAVSASAVLALTSCALVTPSWFKAQENTSFQLIGKLAAGRLPAAFAAQPLIEDCGYGVDCKDPNYSFRAYRNGDFSHVSVCKAFIAYAEDHGASSWRRDPEYKLHPLREKGVMRALPECVALLTAASATEASSTFQMHGRDRKTKAPLMFSLWAAQLGGTHTYGMSVETIFIKPGSFDAVGNPDPFPEWLALRALVNRLADARTSSSSLLTVEQAQTAIGKDYPGKSALVTGKDGFVHAVSLVPDGRMKPLCLSVEPWDPQELRIDDPGAPYDAFIVHDRLISSFGFAQNGECKD